MAVPNRVQPGVLVGAAARVHPALRGDARAAAGRARAARKTAGAIRRAPCCRATIGSAAAEHESGGLGEIAQTLPSGEAWAASALDSDSALETALIPVERSNPHAPDSAAEREARWQPGPAAR